MAEDVRRAVKRGGAMEVIEEADAVDTENGDGEGRGIRPHDPKDEMGYRDMCKI